MFEIQPSDWRTVGGVRVSVVWWRAAVKAVTSCFRHLASHVSAGIPAAGGTTGGG